MLPGVCPGCGLKADLDVFCAQAEVRHALAAALLLPASLGRRALAYLRLFSPPQKALSLAKAGRLLAELQDAVASGQIRRNHLDRVAPLRLWERALDLLIDRPPDHLPLRDHAYLFQTVWNLAESAAARAETHPGTAAPVAAVASAPTDVADAAPAPQWVPPPPEFRALLAKLKGRIITPQAPTQEPVHGQPLDPSPQQPGQNPPGQETTGAG